MAHNKTTSPRLTYVVILLSGLLTACLAASSSSGSQSRRPTSLDYRVSAVPERLQTLSWKLLLEDAEGDDAGINEADGKALFYAEEPDSDRIWFRFDLYAGFDADRPAMSLSFDLDEDPKNGVAWYGANRAFMVDSMLSVGILNREGDRWGGYNGITDAEGIRNRDWINIKKGVATLHIDTEQQRYYVGLDRSDLGPTAATIRVIGSVGMNARWNDDIGDTEPATLSF